MCTFVWFPFFLLLSSLSTPFSLSPCLYLPFVLLFACRQSEAFVCKLHAFALQLMYISGIQAAKAKSRVGKWERESGRGGRHSCWICIAKAKQGELTWLQSLKHFFFQNCPPFHTVSNAVFGLITDKKSRNLAQKCARSDFHRLF